MNNHPINIISLITEHIHTIANRKTSLLPYGCILTHLFTSLNIDLGDEEFKPHSIYHTINKSTVTSMHYKRVKEHWVY